MDEFVTIFFAAALPILGAAACAQSRDLQELFARLRTGESVEIIDQQNDDTAIPHETQDSAMKDRRMKDGGGSPAAPQSFT
jgi:hypothetical protein